MCACVRACSVPALALSTYYMDVSDSDMYVAVYGVLSIVTDVSVRDGSE